MKNILVAPLNWGLGHATRCIPIIKALEENGFNPIIASDGIALDLLRKEFPHLLFETLNSYSIKYAEKGKFFKIKLISQIPSIISAYFAEKKQIKELEKKYNLAGIISDNRLGAYSNKTKSIFISHQLTLLSGTTSWLTTKIHNYIINKYDMCWVPDFEKEPNLSGVLGHPKIISEKIKYIGPLSRLKKMDIQLKYKYLILLSGPEPQRTILEQILKKEIEFENDKIVFVCGKIELEKKVEIINNITYYNYMDSKEIETTINESEFIISRSGYTTIMDLAVIGKKAYFIPTPGQYEQEYLARYLFEKNIAGYCNQNEININTIKDEISKFKGLAISDSTLNFSFLFKFFQTK